MAISSSSPTVAARCSYARAGVGAVASQNVADPILGPFALELMAGGMSATEAIAGVRDQGRFIEYRQVLAVDGAGQTAIHSGENALGIWSQAQDVEVASGGNLLANDQFPNAIVREFMKCHGHLSDCLIAALRAGLDADGEAGPVHSAGLRVVGKIPRPAVDLRCNWTEDCPIETVVEAWSVHKPQLEAYVQRALDPSAAPPYGVPGDA